MANKAKTRKEEPLTRRQVVIRDHVDLSTSDLQSRATLHRATEARADAEIERLEAELKNQRRISRAAREEASALEAIISSRR